MHIHVPPLRRRLEDIPALASHFIENCCRRNGFPPKEAGQDVLDMLSIYPWPRQCARTETRDGTGLRGVGQPGAFLPGICPTEIRISLAKSRLSFPGTSFGDAPSSTPSHPGLTSHEAGDLLPSPQQIPHQARQDSFPTLRESRAGPDAEYLEALLPASAATCAARLRQREFLRGHPLRTAEKTWSGQGRRGFPGLFHESPQPFCLMALKIDRKDLHLYHETSSGVFSRETRSRSRVQQGSAAKSPVFEKFRCCIPQIRQLHVQGGDASL